MTVHFPSGSKLVDMPLSGEYEPSTWDWAREHADKYMESGGTEGTDMKGKPLILLTTIGAKSGKIRKTPLMRVEHDGEYAIVASLGGAPKHPVWYHNVKAHPRVELQDGAGHQGLRGARGFRRREGRLVGTRGRGLARTTRNTRRRPTGRFRCSC